MAALKMAALFWNPSMGTGSILKKRSGPGPGGELCIANLHGTWHMTTGEVEGWSYNAREEGLASTLVFESRWSDAIEGYVLSADYYFADFLDTDEPKYRQEAELRTELLEEPLFHGLSNELWSVRLFHDDTGAEFFLTLTDPDTLYLQEHYEKDGAPGGPHGGLPAGRRIPAGNAADGFV